jgi:hypothetical protein
MLLAFSLFFALCLSAAHSAAQETAPIQVLVLASYYPGLAWEDNILSEIKHHFAIFMPSAQIRAEYMDTKRIPPDEKRLAELKEVYQQKFSQTKQDIIISADTESFNFLRVNRDEIFPGVPVVFCGVINLPMKR